MAEPAHSTPAQGPASPEQPTTPRPPAVDARPPAFRGDAGWSVDEIDPDYPDVEGVSLDGVTIRLPGARTVSLLRSVLVGCTLEVDDDVPLDIHDCVVRGLDLTGRRITDLTRVRLERCRLGGADLGEARIRDAVFDECVLDLSAWRGATIERTVVAGGRVDGLDWTGAALSDVRLEAVALREVSLDGVRAQRVDVTGADLHDLPHVAALAGFTVSSAQAMALAARLARALRIDVR